MKMKYLIVISLILYCSIISCTFDGSPFGPPDGENPPDNGTVTGSLQVTIVHSAGNAVNADAPIVVELKTQTMPAVRYTGKFTDNKPGTITLTGVQAGAYNLAIFHDKNNNAKWDANEPFAIKDSISIIGNSETKVSITLPAAPVTGDNVLNVNYDYTGSYTIDAEHPLVLSAKNLTEDFEVSIIRGVKQGTYPFTDLPDGVYGISIYYDDNNNQVQDNDEPQKVSTAYMLLLAQSTGNASITLTDDAHDSKSAAIAPPTDFALLQVTTSSLQISWTAPAGGADGYVVYARKQSEPGYSLLNIFSNTNCTVTGLESGDYIYFMARAIKAFSVSDLSTSFPCRTKASPPGNFQATKDFQIHFYWDEVPYASSYRLKESSDEAQTQDVTIHAISSATTYDLFYSPGTVRYYSISTWIGSVETQSDFTSPLQDVNPCPPPSMGEVVALSSSSIQLSWSYSTGAQTYNIYRDVSIDGAFTTLAGTAADRPFTDTNLDPLTTYYYRVSAVGESSLTESPKSDAGSATTLSGVPAPQNASATEDRLDDVLITWDAVPVASYYQVFRSTQYDGAYGKISGNIASPTTQYVDNTGTLDAWYYYKVKAFNSDNDPSDFSLYSAGRPVRIAAPSTINGTFGTYNNKITLTWGKVTGAAYYKLYRANTEYGTYEYLADVPGGEDTTTYDDTSAASFAGFNAFYKVSAVSAGGNESWLSTQKGKGYAAYSPATDLIPAAVTAVYADGQVTITWSLVSGYTHYQVTRLILAGLVWDRIIASDTTALSATDSAPVSGREYKYIVSLIDSAGRVCAYSAGDNELIP